MKKAEKEQVVAEVSELISGASSLFFTDFTGMTVAESNELRRELQKNGVKYRVVKNTLAKKALKETSYGEMTFEYLTGPTAIAFGLEDPVAPAKVLKKFFDKSQKPKTKVFVVEKQVFDGKKLADFAGMPSKNELIASILGSLQSPVAGVVGSISAVMRDLVSVIDEVSKKLPAAKS